MRSDKPAPHRGQGALVGGRGQERALCDVLRELSGERGLSQVQVVRGARAASSCHAMTIYKVMNGSTPDPRLSTLAAICRALDVRPQEVFERTGLWSRKDESAQQAALRGAWTAVACLPDAERLRITQVVRALVEAAHAQRERRVPTESC